MALPSHLNLSKSQIQKVLFNVFSFLIISSTAQAGGLDAGGNGVFIKTSSSINLVSLDLFVNEPTFADNASGDKIEFQVQARANEHLGEWIDYRDFASFRLLQSKIASWSGRAKNLISLINENEFASQGKSPFPILLIGTALFVQVLDEELIPESVASLKAQAFPAAYFDRKTGKIFVNADLWNRAGLVSQAATLLHERLRTVQTRIQLPNIELQKIVYLILNRDPKTVSDLEFDDSRFSKSALAIHAKPVDINALDPISLSPVDGYFHALVFDCMKDSNPSLCMGSAIAKFMGKSYPNVPPSAYLVADADVKHAVESGYLARQNPGGFELVSHGSQNAQPPAISTKAPFSKMYGVYSVVSCTNNSKKPGLFMLCGYEGVHILPMPKLIDTTSIGLANNLPGGGVAFVGLGLHQIYDLPGHSYVENGNLSASEKSESSNQFMQMKYETTIRRVSETDYVMDIKGYSMYRGSVDWDYDYQIVLRKQ